MSAFDFELELDSLREKSLLRRRKIADSACGPEVIVDGKPVLAFCSNDYLGLAAAPEIAETLATAARKHGVGSGASHLISGHHRLHEQLETRLAEFSGLARTLTFSTGYMANMAVIAALARRGDAVFSDALNHASLIDACRLSRAEIHKYPHCDVAALANQMAQSSAPRKLVVTDAVFSMDGDIAPVAKLLELCERHDAMLVIDDAHGFGVLGDDGRGTLSHFGIESPRIVYVGTLGKSAGVAGAFVGGSTNLVEWLLQKGRTYIFTTAAPPPLAAALIKAIDLVEHGDQRRTHLQRIIERFRTTLHTSRWQLLDSQTAIQPLIIGSNDETLRVADTLMNEGLWAPAIRPPTVPAGSSRLRISFSAAHTDAHVDRLIDALHRAESAAH
ncbi:MAG: 8-amino-7-oxononanoate synthase [Betaproteobacteria bacterium]|jgi:8-amino-7-oxononanoate synthase|nr:MAG: 8-amino-7-oxononanoate synthase [Betaproteobacteria bacterium]